MVRLLSQWVTLSFQASIAPLFEPREINPIWQQSFPLLISGTPWTKGTNSFNIVPRVKIGSLGCFYERVEESRSISSINCLAKQPIFSTSCKSFSHHFTSVVRRSRLYHVEVSSQVWAVFIQVVNRLTHGSGRTVKTAHFFQNLKNCIDDKIRLISPQREKLFYFYCLSVKLLTELLVNLVEFSRFSHNPHRRNILLINLKYSFKLTHRMNPANTVFVVREVTLQTITHKVAIIPIELNIFKENLSRALLNIVKQYQSPSFATLLFIGVPYSYIHEAALRGFPSWTLNIKDRNP